MQALLVLGLSHTFWGGKIATGREIRLVSILRENGPIEWCQLSSIKGESFRQRDTKGLYNFHTERKFFFQTLFVQSLVLELACEYSTHNLSIAHWSYSLILKGFTGGGVEKYFCHFLRSPNSLFRLYLYLEK